MNDLDNGQMTPKEWTPDQQAAVMDSIEIPEQTDEELLEVLLEQPTWRIINDL